MFWLVLITIIQIFVKRHMLVASEALAIAYSNHYHKPMTLHSLEIRWREIWCTGHMHELMAVH